MPVVKLVPFKPGAAVGGVEILFPEQRESIDTQCPHCGAEITEWVEPPGR